MLCVCQALFMVLQFPRIGWEPIYMPICEAINYGAGWGAHRHVSATDSLACVE